MSHLKMSCSLECLDEIVTINLKRKAPISLLLKRIHQNIMVMLILMIFMFRVTTVTPFHKKLVEGIDQACSG